MNPYGLMLTDDLIFFSRVSGTARAAGLNIRQAKTVADLLTLSRQQFPTAVILDLQNPGLDLPTLLAELQSAGPVMPRTIAYGSHVEAAVLRDAREAGCDRVMPRSKFVGELEGSIAEWLKPPCSTGS